MKTRVTFRVAGELAEALRELPNQTYFVEKALRDALGMTCPTCDGTGRVKTRSLRVSSFRELELGSPLDRETARQLQALVRMARQAAATEVALSHAEDGLSFRVLQGSSEMLRGRLSPAITAIQTH